MPKWHKIYFLKTYTHTFWKCSCILQFLSFRTPKFQITNPSFFVHEWNCQLCAKLKCCEVENVQVARSQFLKRVVRFMIFGMFLIVIPVSCQKQGECVVEMCSGRITFGIWICKLQDRWTWTVVENSFLITTATFRYYKASSSELNYNDLSRIHLSASKNDVLVMINWSNFLFLDKPFVKNLPTKP